MRLRRRPPFVGCVLAAALLGLPVSCEERRGSPGFSRRDEPAGPAAEEPGAAAALREAGPPRAPLPPPRQAHASEDAPEDAGEPAPDRSPSPEAPAGAPEAPAADLEDLPSIESDELGTTGEGPESFLEDADGEMPPAESFLEDADGEMPPAESALEEAAPEAPLLDDPAAASSAPVEIDRERSEVRIPCRFVNPSRQIEVFACHRRGPTHETVVEFDAAGEDLYSALLAIGCRPADYWNVTSLGDFARNQGDRVLVLVRWTWEGKTVELPAEAMLVDGVTEFHSFVRGFSFSAHDVDAAADDGAEPAPPAGAASRGDPAAGDPAAEGLEAGEEEAADPAGPEPQAPPRRRRIPLVVEISLSATHRQQAVFALLSHPTALSGEPATPGGPPTRALQPWSMPPLVDARVLPDLERLVEAQPEATLIFRRLRSEADLARFARSLAQERGDAARAALIDQIAPAAAAIDRLKARYEVLGAEIRALVATDPGVYYGDGQGDLMRRGELLRREGQWLCHRIQELYFEIYEKQDRFRLSELGRRPDLDSGILDMARGLLEDGLKYEVRIAALEAESHALRLRDNLLSLEIWALELERTERMIIARQEDVRRRIRELGEEETYVRRLHEEDLDRWQTARRAVKHRMLLCEALLEENRSALEGGESPIRRKRWELARRAAEAGLRKARLEEGLLEVQESLRWAQDDLESDLAERRERAREELGKLEKRRVEIEASLREAARQLEDLEASLGEANRRAEGLEGRSAPPSASEES